MCNPLLAIHHLVPDEIIVFLGNGHNCSIQPPPHRIIINVMVIDGSEKSIFHGDLYLSQGKVTFYRK